MLNINRIFKNERQMLSLTGLNSKEFKELLPTFSAIWQKKKRYYHCLHTTGTRAFGGGRKGFLPIKPNRKAIILARKNVIQLKT